MYSNLKTEIKFEYFLLNKLSFKLITKFRVVGPNLEIERCKIISRGGHLLMTNIIVLVIAILIIT